VKKFKPYSFGILLVGLALIAIPLTGCKQAQSNGEVEAAATAVTYGGRLRTDYTDALGAADQLALGLLRLEDTAHATTAEQAAKTLPWWTMLQGTALKTDAERLAVVKQIEDTLTEAQVAAIQEMQLTQADAQAWLQEQGPMQMGQGGEMPSGGDMPSGGGRPSGGAMPSGDMQPPGGQQGGFGGNMSDADREAMRAQFEAMSDEERAKMREQFAAQGGGRTAGGGASMGASGLLLRAVVRLLTERSGQAPAEPPTSETATSEATAAAPVPTATPTIEPTSTPLPRVTLEVLKTPTPTTTSTPTVATAATTAAAKPATAQTATTASSAATATPEAALSAAVTQGALTQKTDTDPGPPLTIEVTTNYAEANPNLEGGLIYHVAGFVRNPTEETYQVTAVHVTFFDASGFRGAFYAFPPRPGQRGMSGEWIAHGAMAADIVCPLLGPGEACPFTAEIAAQDMASFLVHPDAKIAEWHESVPVTLSDLKAADTGTGYVRITGTATNPNSYAIKNVNLSGMLLDTGGQMVSLGNGLVTHLEAGASTAFEVYVPKEAYASFQVTALAEQVAQ